MSIEHLSVPEESVDHDHGRAEAPIVKAAYDMVSALNEANDGKNTEIASARELLQDAREMCAGLEEVLDEGPDVIGDALTALRNAIHNLSDNLNVANKQVH